MPEKVVFPLTVAFDADGTAVLNQVAQETVTEQDADWDIYISEASGDAVFTAFSVADGIATGANKTSADIVVSTQNSATVTAAIKYALLNAKGGPKTDEGASLAASAGGKTLGALLVEYVQSEVEKDLSTTGLYNILEAEGLLSVAIPMEAPATTASADMWTAIDTAPADVKNVMATQLPYERYASIPDGGDLVFNAGDEMILQFTVNSKLAVTPQKEDVTGLEGGDAGVAAQAAFNSSTKSRTLNVHFIKSA